MSSEMAALAASGATTLVGLMLTDAWEQARDRAARFLSRNREQPGGAVGAAAALDTAHRSLLAARNTADEALLSGATAQWRARLEVLLRCQPGGVQGLRELLDSLEALEVPAAGREQPGVRNVISGGIQHGPVIQSGHIGGLTLPSPAPRQQEQPQHRHPGDD
ncbi:hypothetical protein PJ985_03145 [Streptomyces sp. ACA25]|uniref:hypothetical protein n=1 Tax=Streptomyces sp. ACA25 TaxID=3022596 RepID=UPI0023071053|nr:hypothetical protein [Streptomyces sp. ACA25]MDB1086562.1 hypothetical protein [Streptomyces sp. ACA25]